MEHFIVNNQQYKFEVDEEALVLFKMILMPEPFGEQWINVLTGDLLYGEVEGHYNGFTVQDLKIFIDKFDEIKQGR